jgi:uncharacterized protein YndB with AHSA1/START domain
MESATETTSVVREIAIDAAPETVWEFLVDPEKAVRWMGGTAELDPRPGGLYRVDAIAGQYTARGEFVELDPPRRLVHTFGWEPSEGGPNPVPAGSTTIEIELVPEGGGTVLRFRHRDLPDAAATEMHAHGWDRYLGRLAVAAAGGDPGPDRAQTDEMS